MLHPKWVKEMEHEGKLVVWGEEKKGDAHGHHAWDVLYTLISATVLLNVGNGLATRMGGFNNLKVTKTVPYFHY